MHRVALAVVRESHQLPPRVMSEALKEGSVGRQSRCYPNAVACFVKDYPTIVSLLTPPPFQRKSIRTTVLPESLFRIERRRGDRTGRVSGNRREPKAVLGAGIPVTGKQRDITISDLARRRSERLQVPLRGKHRNEVASAVEPASDPARIHHREGK